MKPFRGVEDAEDWRLENCAKCARRSTCPLEDALDQAAERDGELNEDVAQIIGLSEYGGEECRAKLGPVKDKVYQNSE